MWSKIVAPRVGAWIEIFKVTEKRFTHIMRRAPCGRVD